MTNRPNPEQQAIVKASLGGKSMAVSAGAGTGKTSTLVQVAEANKFRQMLYLAYNASTKEEGKRRFPRNVRVVTGHGLAYGSVGKNYGHRLNAGRVTSRRAASILQLQDTWFRYCVQCETPDLDGSHSADSHAVMAEHLEGWRIASLIKRTLERFCYSADSVISRSHAPRVQGFDARIEPQVKDLAAQYATQVWRTDCTSTEGRLWYWPDLYLKLFQLQGPYIRQRTIMLDEAQDTNPCVADIVLQQSGKQLLIVGDSNQAIYEWRGAVDYMDKVEVEHRLQLTGSYRFGPAVAEEANKWLALLGSPLQLKGYRRLASLVTDQEQDEEPDAVLYRSNAGCIAGAMRGLEAGKEVAIVGGGNAIRWLAEAAEDLQNGRKTEHPDLVGFEDWASVQQYCKDEPQDAGTLVPLVKAVDEHGPAAIMEMTSRLVSEERATLVVSTAHKAKGLEWSHVRIGDDFPMPVPGRDLPKEELRLAYVAITRAKLVLERGSLAYIDNLI